MEDEQQQQPPPRWKDERDRERERDRDRKGKDDRPNRPKESGGPKEEDGAGPKEGTDPRTSSAEDQRAMGKDPRANAHMQFSSALAQHQGYMPYMHGYPYGQGYDPSHPGYRGMPTVMMQNYPGNHTRSTIGIERNHLGESAFAQKNLYTNDLILSHE